VSTTEIVWCEGERNFMGFERGSATNISTTKQSRFHSLRRTTNKPCLVSGIRMGFVDADMYMYVIGKWFGRQCHNKHFVHDCYCCRRVSNVSSVVTMYVYTSVRTRLLLLTTTLANPTFDLISLPLTTSSCFSSRTQSPSSDTSNVPRPSKPNRHHTLSICF
jgi:hypothetical protein